MKIIRRSYFIFFAFCALFLFYFSANIFSGKLFCYRDIGRYYYPTRYFVSESVVTGDFPLWNPYIFCGYPSFASLQQATLYPLSILYLVFPFFDGFNYFFIIHFVIAALGMYLLLRELAVSATGSFIGAVCFSLCGYTVSMINLLTTLSAIVWLPFGVLFSLHSATLKNKTGLLFWSLVIVLQFFAGQPEIAFITFLLTCFAFFCPVLPQCNQHRSGQIDQKILAVFFVFVAFLALIAVQLFPFWELLQNSIRFSEGNQWKTVWSLHPLEMINFLIPSFTSDLVAGSSVWFSQAWMKNGYIGIVTLALVWCGIRYKRNNKWFFIITGILGLLLSLGEFIPGLSLFYKYLPGFNMIRYPVKYIGLFYFAIAVLAGFGADSVFAEGISRKKLSWLVMLLLILSGGFLLFLKLKPWFLEFFEKVYLYQLTPVEKTVFYYHFPELLRDYAFGILFLGGFLILFWFRKKFPRKVFSIVSVALLIVSIVYGTYGQEPLVEKKFFTVPTGNTYFLKNNLGEGRYYISPKSSAEAIKKLTILPEVDFKEDFYKRQKVVLPNLGVVHHLPTADGYESIKLKHNEHLKNLLASRPLSRTAKYLNLLGVKYLLSFYPIEENQFSLIRDDYIYFYENTKRGKRAALFYKANFMEDKQRIDQLLDRDDFNPLEEVIIHHYGNDFQPIITTQRPVSYNVGITDNSTRAVAVAITTSDHGWLVLTDTFYPGWKAYLDGEKTDIYQADYMLRAVFVPRGDHELVFRYQPDWFYRGLAVSLLMLVIIIFHYGKKAARAC